MLHPLVGDIFIVKEATTNRCVFHQRTQVTTVTQISIRVNS